VLSLKNADAKSSLNKFDAVQVCDATEVQKATLLINKKSVLSIGPRLFAALLYLL